MKENLLVVRESESKERRRERTRRSDIAMKKEKTSKTNDVALEATFV